jgi:signal transduction histidine kinase
MKSTHDGTDATTLRALEPLLAQAGPLCIPDTAGGDFRNRLLQFQKLAALGRVAVGAAHDLNNLLGVILCYAEVLRTEPTLDDRVRAQAEQIIHAADRAADLTQQVLHFGRRRSVTEATDLGTVVDGLRPVLTCLTGNAVQLTIAPPTGPCRARVDPGEVEQVVMNLVLNARDATPPGGRIVVTTTLTHLDQDQPHAGGVIPAGAYALLSISDTGCGMDPALLKRIFEPFFTTKEPAKGTGLGLVIVSSIVAQSHGFLSVWSEPGNGTRFDVYWPLCE